MQVDIGNKKFRVRLSKAQWGALWALILFCVTWVVRVEVQLDVLRYRLAQCVDQQQQLQKELDKALAAIRSDGNNGSTSP